MVRTIVPEKMEAIGGQCGSAGDLDPDLAVEQKIMRKDQTLPQRRQCVSTSQKAAAVRVLRNDVKQMEAESQAPKRTLNLNTPVSSLLQVCPLLIFNCGIRENVWAMKRMEQSNRRRRLCTCPLEKSL